MKVQPYIHIGTSGWFYYHWKNFYQDRPSSEWLQFYSEHFITVEVNSTYYHLPKKNSVKKWFAITPKDFVFSVKFNRQITHIKRLENTEREINNFLKSIAPLKSKLGPLLFLLPPSFKLNFEALKQCITRLPKKHLYTFEFRNASWHVPAVYDLLKKYNIALCISDLNGKLSPIEITASFVYVRLHGPKIAYKGIYSLQTLKKWAERINEWETSKLNIYVYFDNDEKGFAITDAKKLIKLLDLEKGKGK
jgi:uncharacterized protein YecE (DUF72 family)